MIFKKAKDLTFVLYQDRKTPRSFKISRSQFKTITLLLPLITVISLLFIIIGNAHFQGIILQAKSYKPQLLLALKEKNIELESKLNKVTAINSQLTVKLGQVNTPVNAITPIFKATPFKDLTQKNHIQIENIQPDIQKKRISIRFNILNGHPQQKRLSGHIFILAQSGNHLMVYPKSNNGLETGMTSFSLGETFTVSRFRPVEASFENLAQPNKPISFQIVIFSRTGDLLFKRNIGPIVSK